MLKSNFAICSTMNIHSIYKDRMHFVSMPTSPERFPLLASLVQTIHQCPCQWIVITKKNSECTIRHHLQIINNQITAESLRGASPVWQLCKGRNILLCKRKHRQQSPAEYWSRKNARDQLQFEASSRVPVLYACMLTWERTATGNPFRSTNSVNVNYSSFLETVTLVSLWKQMVQTDNWIITSQQTVFLTTIYFNLPRSSFALNSSTMASHFQTYLKWQRLCKADTTQLVTVTWQIILDLCFGPLLQSFLSLDCVLVYLTSAQ